MPTEYAITSVLAVVGVLLLRLLSGIDKNTTAVGDLNVTVRELGVLLAAQRERLGHFEADYQRNITALAESLEIVRGRVHGLANDIAACNLKLEVHIKRIPTSIIS